MMRRLRAEETIDQLNAGACAAGTMRRDAAERYVREVEREARSGSAQRPPAPTPAVLATMGIAVVEVDVAQEAGRD
jgi:hypothetical protein